MAFLHGRATIRVNGATLKSAEGATLEKGGWTKSSVTGDQGYYGKQRAFRPSKIECTCAFGPEDSMDQFDFDDAVVTFECDSGQTFVIKKAGTVGELPLSKEGVKLTIEGDEAKEML